MDNLDKNPAKKVVRAVMICWISIYIITIIFFIFLCILIWKLIDAL